MGRATSLYKNRKGQRIHKAIYQRKIGSGKWGKYTLYSSQTYPSSSPPLLFEGNGGSGPTHLRDDPNTQVAITFQIGPNSMVKIHQR